MAEEKAKQPSIQSKVFGKFLSNNVTLETMNKMKELLKETIKIDVDLHDEYVKIEKKYEEAYNELYEKRLQILKNYKKQLCGDNIPDNMELNHFWLKVLKTSMAKLIQKDDEVILKYLIDIRTKLFTVPSMMFAVQFYFEPNAFFANTILTKTYYIKSLLDDGNPLSFDGGKIWKCEGCTIEWNKKLHANMNRKSPSFFDYFAPPVLPDAENEDYDKIKNFLEHDYKLGFYFKERVIPKAIMFFTGEIDEYIEISDSEEGQEEQDN